jgi:pyruvate kinase
MISRKTRIVCTIGPASSNEAVMEKMLLAGMNVARLNFSHGDHGSHRQNYEKLRKLSAKLGKPLGILADLCGPKIRLGQMAPQTVVEAGQTFTFLTQPMVGDQHEASITYSNLPNEIEIGQRILVDDGKIEFLVTEVRDGKVITEAKNSGLMLSKKGVNLPGVALSVPSVTDKDKDDLQFALELGIDFIALSFIRKPEDLSETRRLMRDLGREVPLIAKIEKLEALDHLGAIIAESDAIMIARGDLGVELPLEDVPLIQKRIITKCKAAARPVITATQMLESMTEVYRPTRAEVNDVANAILDGTDAVMLSAETASGHFPEESIAVMHRIALKAETGLDYQGVHQLRPHRGDVSEAVALAAVEISEEVSAKAILACTRSGRTVRALSRFRPRAPILGIASDERVLRQFSLSWGVTPVGIEEYTTTDELVAHAMTAALSDGGLRAGDTVVIVAGTPLGHRTNTVMVRTLLTEPG